MSRSSKTPSSDPHSIPLLSSPPDEEERSSASQPLYTPRPPPKRSLLNRYSWIVAAVLIIVFIGLLAVPKPSWTPGDQDDYDDDAPVPDSSGICKQSSAPKLPDDDLSRALGNLLDSEDYLRESAERLSKAVQIRTEAFDDMGPVGHDPRWDVFQDFHDFLAKSYPKV
jgi:Gly-Xaa carboxypeptidase